VNLEKSRDKLEEARFFLRQLCQVPDVRTAENPNAVKYYFSAFLSAAYSVAEHLRTEVIGELRSQARATSIKKDAKENYEHWQKQWYDALSDEERLSWKSLTEQAGMRGKEVHVERTETVTKERTIVVDRLSSTRRSSEYEAYYLMRQQVAPFYPDTKATKYEMGFPMTINLTAKVQELFAEIGGSQRAIAEICEQQVALLDRFVRHFEQLVP
jgi:hypothetical protein